MGHSARPAQAPEDEQREEHPLGRPAPGKDALPRDVQVGGLHVRQGRPQSVVEIEQGRAHESAADEQEGDLLATVVGHQRQGPNDEGQDRRHGLHDRVRRVAGLIDDVAP